MQQQWQQQQFGVLIGHNYSRKIISEATHPEMV
jgi:hypothetical protein